MSISYNKSLSLTGRDIYQQTYDSQYLEILANSTSYLIGSLTGAALIYFIGDVLIKKTQNQYFYVLFLLSIVLFIIIPLAMNLLTYKKINSSKNSIIDK
jgi:Na+/melibiose symporter-like transporter